MNSNITAILRRVPAGLAIGAVLATACASLLFWVFVHDTHAEGGRPATVAREAQSLTFADYDRAFHEYIDCLAGVGWQLTATPTLTSRGEYDFQIYRPGSDPNSSDSARAGWEGQRENCRRLYFDGVQAAWSLKNAMSDRERQQARDVLGACLRSAGYDVPLHPSTADWDPFGRIQPGVTNPAATRAFLGCAKETAAKFGLRTGEVP